MSLSKDALSNIKAMYDGSMSKQQGSIGKRYYSTNNDIMDRKLYIYAESGLMEDPYKANNKIASDYYKMLVDQCVSYLIGKKPKTEFEIDTSFHTVLIEISKNAKAKGIQWVHLYIKDNQLKLELMETEQMLPVYEDEELVEMYRFYMQDNKQVVDRYTSSEIEKYIDGKYIGTEAHMGVITQEGAEVKTGFLSWGKVPFIPLKNNESCVYDLKSIKTLIDNYDKIISDFANNLEDNQDVYWILKGYSGNLSAFTEQVKMYKSIPVSAEGDVSSETLDIPHEARMMALDKLENLIFKFGRGVNIEQLTGGSLTNVAIRSAFSNLDMKANEFSIQIKKFISLYVEFYNIYASYTNKPLIADDYIEFEKSIIVNENENLTSNAEQMGSVSLKTRLDNHPWVEDVEEEIELIESARTILDIDDEEEQQDSNNE